MKKHIIGLTLFSFIVGASALIYAFFNMPEIVQISEVATDSTPRFYANTTGLVCNKKDKSSAVKIRQAVFNLQTKEFNWELATPDINEQIALHFFSKDADSTRYITTEKINNKFSYNGVLKFSDSYRWLNKSDAYENLYVIAQFDSEAVNYSEVYRPSGSNQQPKFDPAKATAVTVDYGK